MPSPDGGGPTPSVNEVASAARGSHGRPTRIAFLSYSSGEFDARTFRMARSAIEAGYDVTVYARWHRGLAPVEQRDGYRLVRASWEWQLGVPVLRRRARRRIAAAMAQAARGVEPAGIGAARATPPSAGLAQRIRRARPFERWHWWVRVREFLLRPRGWAAALQEVVEPADIWHGMWVGSLPAVLATRRRLGGRAIYDSRDVFMRSREYARLGQPGRGLLARIERRWAGQVDRVLTVNDAYATLLAGDLRVPRPAVVMNCPAVWTPPSPRPDLIRRALDIPTQTAVILYQGRLTAERGIEQAVEAILEVPDAILVLLGFGVLEAALAEQASRPPYAGRVRLLPPVPPDDLLRWSASADALVMAIQPTTTNHRYTTPQKLFEAMAAGVPVVASDLPGMAPIVQATGAGVLCDPTSPASIAAAIRHIVDAPPDEREAMRARALRAAHERYNWETQVETLLALYRELVPPPAVRPDPSAG
jgi:glycosyltransferase involved in cell wall biosynthesis